MPLVTLRQALDAAAEGGFAVGAFNVSDLTQAEAVLDAASATDSPVVVQALAGASAHRSEQRWWAALRAMIASYDDVPAVLHLDHGPSPEVCQRAIAAGFTSVMIDATIGEDRRTPASFEENVAVTAEVAAFAHTAGVSVEGELGTIGGVQEGPDGDAGQRLRVILADPAQAAAFVARTQVDALAVAIGTSHGTSKFSAEPDGSVLHMELIEQIAARVPGTHLVMHGSSTLPPELIAEINENGGAIARSWGVPMAEKVRSIDMGIRKINQGVDSQLAYAAALRSFLATSRASVDPGTYLAEGRRRMQDMLEQRLRAFRSAGRAQDLLTAVS